MNIHNSSATDINFPVNEYDNVSIFSGCTVELDDNIAEKLLSIYPFLEVLGEEEMKIEEAQENVVQYVAKPVEKKEERSKIEKIKKVIKKKK